MNRIKKNLAVYLPRIETWALSGISHGEIETVARHVSEWIAADFDHPLITFSRSIIEKSTNIPNKFSKNGEQFMLDRLVGLPFRTLFDVGANVGTWSRYALRAFPGAELHGFEIVPDTFKLLRKNLAIEPRIHLNDFGLSDAAGTAMINIYKSNLISSMFSVDGDDGVVSKLNCRVGRGCDYVAELGISTIDFLKIDVEGAEGKVLSGFEPLLSDRRIRLVQFEYNRGAILGDFLLKNAYAFFRPKGYQLGKLTPTGVHFHDYRFMDEDFLGPNYVACHASDAELISRISA